MEQHTARTSTTARQVPAALPSKAAPAASAAASGSTAASASTSASAPPRPSNRLAAAAHRLRALPRPRPRLTGLGTGALTTVVTVLGGAVDSLLFDGPGVLFGLVFIAVCIAAAVYVRPYDLVAAPVAAPIAFAVGITLTADSGDGSLLGHVVGVFTGLALMTGWLYTGTVLAAAIVAVRALRQPSRRRRSPRCSATPRGRSPR
ncbi:DUF6542 domain-containing protein [Streptomyces sp. NBC_00448]|uniref:DUF6542 domain-containing protein n=1 Tax=Streptomyces sp. NBC_00448 TaxID=2903652 RepID=UPI002E1E791C